MNILALAGNILWIAGLVFIIVKLGWRAWEIRLQRRESSRFSSYKAIDIGIFLFCLGIILATDQIWMRYLFSFLLIASILVAIIESVYAVKDIR